MEKKERESERVQESERGQFFIIDKINYEYRIIGTAVLLKKFTPRCSRRFFRPF